MRKIFAFILALAAVSSVADARKVTGTVMCGEEKLSGVIVTDGRNFTQTKSGKFKFEIEDNAEFVYIVTPSGYVADWSTGIPAFYQTAQGNDRFHFELTRTEPSEEYSIVAIADPQLRNDKHLAQFAAEPMADICETVKGLGGFKVGLALGDICWDSFDMLDKYKAEILRTGIPFYPVAGNHDHDADAKGDVQASAAYRKAMGPENYAFFIGKDVVIVLDNIIYDTQKKYQEGYASHVLSWVKGLESLLPEAADLYIAQHSPILHWDQGRRKIINSHDLIGLVHGHEVHFISGHTHMNNFFEYDRDIVEHNVAAICGSWWDSEHCTDGTPRGYKVFTKKDDRLTWYYKSVGQPKDHQAEMYGMGQTLMHPNSVVVNVWDWDPQWKVEWYQDGVHMGGLEPVTANRHYFAATPSQYAKQVMISVQSRFGQTWVYTYDMKDYVDVQAHRGGAGLKPENSIEAMKNALDLGVNTLEFDLHVSKDGQVVVSHDPYLKSGGYIYTKPYSELDLPLASDLIDFVENYTKENGLSPVRYNVEIKSRNADGESINWPTYDSFVRSCALLLHSKQLGDRLVVQSFDVRALEYMKERYPEFILSYLVGSEEPDFDKFMEKLDIAPEWLSPHHSIVTEELVKKCREKGMKIVPWTVDEPEDIKKMLDLKVDAIISNYPDRVLEQTRIF